MITKLSLAKTAGCEEIREFLRALANVKEVEADVRHFLRKHERYLWEYSPGQWVDCPYTSVPEGINYVLYLRDKLRRIWHGGPDAEKLLTDYLCEDVPV